MRKPTVVRFGWSAPIIRGMLASAFGWFWNPTGHWVIFWSGFGSCLTEFAIIGIVYRKLNCHQDGCKRIGLHKVEGTPYIVCRKHHPAIPDGKVTASAIAEAFHAHRQQQAAASPAHRQQQAATSPAPAEP